ncbi:MAG: DUF6017 domain-containing protein [Oscillospiraceae bacterium]
MEILEKLNPKNTVSFSRPIAHALGLGAAVVYSALIAKQVYYEKRNMLDNEGFFYSTIADLQESTALTKSQQSSAVKLLVEVGLVECKKRGMPARRCFRVCDDVEVLDEYLKVGDEVMESLNPIAQKCENAPSSDNKNAQQEVENSNDKLSENEPYNINPNINKSKVNNPYQSIQSAADRNDVIDKDERNYYLELIHETIGYDCFNDKCKYQIDELVEIMLDVVCSTKSTVRVNGENVPQEVVKSRFLKLGPEHIDYVLTSLKKNTTDVRNIRAYLITALYNSPTTIDSYYTALVNHDMYGSA